jgi:DnaA family protein
MSPVDGSHRLRRSQLPLDLRLRESSRFDTFEPEASGLAAATVRQLATAGAAGAAGAAGERQVFLHGASGTGKTHLLQAACHAAYGAGRSCVYLPLTEFASEDPANVLEGLDGIDLLALDDLQAVTGREDWERALFGLINRVRDGAGRLLLAARSAPEALGCRLPDLVSRCVWGPVFRLDLPGDRSIKTILRMRAAERGLRLEESVVDYLLRHESRDLESLLRLLDDLDLAALAEQRALTIPFIREQLRRSSPRTR